jgi:ABC-type enterobactin transport system permease subunit
MLQCQELLSEMLRTMQTNDRPPTLLGIVVTKTKFYAVLIGVLSTAITGLAPAIARKFV